MYSDKIGEFIKKLREEKKWSQEDLAKKLYVTRQSVSSWENGKNYPHIETLKALSKIFSVNLIELFAGEEIKDNHRANEVVYNVIKNEKKKQKKVIIISLLTIITILITFFIYYFINTYNATKIYRIGTNDDKAYINGIMIKNREMIYFELIEGSLEIKTIALYYKDKKIYETNDNIIIFKENNGYDEYHAFEKDFIENLTLKITTEEEQFDIKLTLNLTFENKNLLFIKNKEIGTGKEEWPEKDIYVPEKIKKEFTYKDDNYELQINEKEKEIQMSYLIEAKLFWVTEINKSEIKEWRFDVNDQFLFYSEKNIKNNISYKFEEYIANFDKGKNKKVKDYFKENYLDKYIYE